ncbi:MAG: tRNA (adenosine(37)-N6)-threonylcarbamoyltransferase complex ATPase subunit type 1 TsaE [Candidatus Melainabacteria bacterium]|nr:tRNA (adenosine(37)-N6)-threonylcarbamoyltransferase complex ATPase subunit type 1 TsaE [Candidatus Melainabacteria bacterium]
MKKLKICNRNIKLSKSPEETFNIAKELAFKITKPLLIGIKGELGSGKTIFAKGFAYGLGVKELITSPTFLGISENFSGRLPFIHMDFYKKVVNKEIVEGYLKKNSVVLIEWVDNYDLVFNKKLPLDIFVYIQYVNDNERQIACVILSNL